VFLHCEIFTWNKARLVSSSLKTCSCKSFGAEGKIYLLEWN